MQKDNGKNIFELDTDLRIEVTQFCELSMGANGVDDDISDQPPRIDIKGYRLRDDDSGEEDLVVSASAYLVPWNNCWEKADDFSHDTAEIAKVICRKDGCISPRYTNEWGSIACFMDRLYVPEKFRNRGFASLLQKNLGDLLQKVVPLLCGIYAYTSPWELLDDKDAYKKRQTELLRFYKKFGFKQIKDTPVIWMPVHCFD